MKQLYFLIFLFTVSICSAQDPQLFENPWYLQKLNIDNTDYLPPNGGYPNSHTFTENPFKFSSSYCDAINVAVTYDNQNTELSFEDYPLFLLGFCTDQQLQNFNDDYFSILYQNSGEARNPFGYTITTNGTINLLEITNPDGDIAYYSNEPLSISEFNVKQISIYPNPVKEKLILKSASKAENLNLKILNIEGKLLITKNLEFEKEISIDVSQLSKGIYFLNIEDKEGNKTIKKFIKE